MVIEYACYYYLFHRKYRILISLTKAITRLSQWMMSSSSHHSMHKRNLLQPQPPLLQLRTFYLSMTPPWLRLPAKPTVENSRTKRRLLWGVVARVFPQKGSQKNITLNLSPTQQQEKEEVLQRH